MPQAGLVAKDSVYQAREERAASAYRSKKSRAKADRVAEALRKGTKLVERLSIQVQAVSISMDTPRSCATTFLALLAACTHRLDSLAESPDGAFIFLRDGDKK